MHIYDPHGVLEKQPRRSKSVAGPETTVFDTVAVPMGLDEKDLQLQMRISELGYSFKVMTLQVKYPQGAEKMLIEATLGRKVPTGKLPMDVGVVVNNVATAIAVHAAVTQGRPLVERMLTVTGDGIMSPGNLTVRLGTPFQKCVEACGGLKEEATQVFMGGPMMGLAQYDLQVPTIKATSGIVCLQTQSVNLVESYPCIRCGNCVRSCPMNLLPTNLAKLAEKNQIAASAELGIMNCIECGSCAFVCPSGIPLVQWIRVGKTKNSRRLAVLKAQAQEVQHD